MATFEIARWGINIEESENRDDLSSAWKECVENGEVWGGRAKGGRGIRLNSGITRDVSVDDVTLSFVGNELLTSARLKFLVGHRYGLIGSNGVGKSTLLRRIARGSIPGFPVHLRIEYVQQELPSVPDSTVRDFIFNAASSSSASEKRKEALLDEEMQLAEMLAEGSEDVDAITERMCAIAEEIEALENPTAATLDGTPSPFVTDILFGLKLETRKRSKMDEQLSALSGGWRMRAALARCLINLPTTDLLLLDEATNHLDMHCVAWLEEFLSTRCDHCILIIVSHDRQFLDQVTTDIVMMKDQKLNYFPGNYSDWQLHEEEVAARNESRLDAQTRKEEHVKKSIEMAKARGHDNVAKAKVKKLERATMTRRLDGKKFHNFSLSKLSEEFVRFPEKVEAIKANRLLRFKFPDPDVVSLRLSTQSSPIITLDRCQVGWSKGMAQTESVVLSGVTLQINLKSRIALVGPNGQGKSTTIAALMQAFSGEVLVREEEATAAAAPVKKGCGLSVVKAKGAVSTPAKPAKLVPAVSSVRTTTATASPALRADAVDGSATMRPFIRGVATSNHNVRVGFVSQHHIDTLSSYLHISPVEYVRLLMRHGGVLPEIGTAEALTAALATGDDKLNETEIRGHLGMFGLGGDVALRLIGSLSGGQKARLAFCASCAHKPHILFLDEPTNHLSIDGMEALAVACREFGGAIVCASHNRHFLSLVCNELWVVEGGLLAVKKAVVEPSASSSTAGAPVAASSQQASAGFSQGVSATDCSFIGLLTEYLDATK